MERWRKLKFVFGRSTALDDLDSRYDYILSHCGEDIDLFLDVARLAFGGRLEGLQGKRYVRQAEDRWFDGLRGQRLGPYRLTERLGKGGSGGAVFKARRGSNKKVLALKVLPIGLTQSRGVTARFEQEYALASRVEVSTARPREFLRVPRAHCYAMDRLKGRTLAKEIRYGRTGKSGALMANPRSVDGIQQVVALMSELCSTVEDIHAAGIVHRDIKPSNIVLKGSTVRVIDFGIARLVTEVDEGRGSGTIGYCSPEQAGMTSFGIGVEADVFSLGSVLFELLTHRHPAEQLSLPVGGWLGCNRLARRICELNPAVSKKLARTCARAVARKPSQRFASAAALGDALVRTRFDGSSVRSRAVAVGRTAAGVLQRLNGSTALPTGA